MKKAIWVMARGLSTFALAALFSHSVQAQTRAAIVKNVDEPGRAPYTQNAFANCGTVGLCDITFPAVPAGRRLVITNVSANIGSIVGVNGAFLLSGSNYFSLPTHTGASNSVIAVNESVLQFYDAGTTPVFRVAFASIDANNVAYALISGHLVDLSL